MRENPKVAKTNLKQSLEYVGKLLSTAVIVVLLLVGAFLIYYVVSAKVLSRKAGAVPKLSLYTIVSGSMEPAIKVYDIILTVRVDNYDELEVGDVITFNSYNSLISDMTITHRIVDIRTNEDNRREFITKGDWNPTADTAPVQETDIIGKTVLKIPQIGRIQFFLATKIGWLFVVLIPALGIIIYDILKLFKVLGITDKTESIEGDITSSVVKEENKKILEVLEKIKQKKTLEINSQIEPQAEILNNKVSSKVIPIQQNNSEKLNQLSELKKNISDNKILQDDVLIEEINDYKNTQGLLPNRQLDSISLETNQVIEENKDHHIYKYIVSEDSQVISDNFVIEEDIQ